MAEKAQLRVRCKQGTLIIAGGQIGVEPGLARWWRPRWRIPCADVTALSASRGLGVTLTLTLHTRDDRQLSVEWLLPHDAQSVASALGYTVSVYDLYEMAAEHALGTPFSYDVLTLEPAPSSIPAVPTLPATPAAPAAPVTPTAPTASRPAEPDFGPQWPIVRILPASETPPPPPSIPERPPSRLRALAARAAALAAVLQVALLAALAALSVHTGALTKRLHAWQMSRSAGQRAPYALSSAPLPERVRGWLAAALASAPTLPERSVPIARAWVRRMRDALQSLQRAIQAQRAASGWRGVLLSLVTATADLLRNRIASATILVALILAVVVASLGATPSRTRYADPSVGDEIGRILPRQALGNLSHTPASPTPSPSPTATAAPTPTPSPAPAPAPAPPPPALTLAFTCASAQNGRLAQVCVHTQPGAALTINVTYCDGRPARNKNLQGTVQANSAGNYTWTWVPTTRCIGPATAVVTARWQGQTTSATITFDVVPLPPPADSPLPLQTA